MRSAPASPSKCMMVPSESTCCTFLLSVPSPTYWNERVRPSGKLTCTTFSPSHRNSWPSACTRRTMRSAPAPPSKCARSHPKSWVLVVMRSVMLTSPLTRLQSSLPFGMETSIRGTNCDKAAMAETPALEARPSSAYLRSSRSSTRAVLLVASQMATANTGSCRRGECARVAGYSLAFARTRAA